MLLRQISCRFVIPPVLEADGVNRFMFMFMFVCHGVVAWAHGALSLGVLDMFMGCAKCVVFCFSKCVHFGIHL